MLKPKLRVLCLFILLSSATAAQTLKYAIDILPKNEGDPKISVSVEFYHGNYDTVYFSIPTRINQAAHLFRSYRNWSVTGGRIVKRDTNFIAIKRTEKNGATMQLNYDIFQSTPGDAVTRTNSSAPLIQPDYIHIRGYSLLLVPLHYKICDVTVNWNTIPKNWTIQNSFSSGTRQQHFLFNDRDTWRRSNWVAGDFRQYTGKVYGKPVYFAVRGQWIFEDTTLFRMILHTVETQRKQWNDQSLPYYSVTLIPYVMPRHPGEWDAQSLCLGNGLYQSFVTYADPECLLDNFIDLFNHEMMHEWIGGKIDEGETTEDNSMRWFAEGFTEYYALRNRYKAGFIGEAAFFKELNQDYFADHYKAPYAEIKNIESEKRRWESFEMERVAYRRGCIAAFYFDCAIRKRTSNQKTLFNCMADLLEFTYGTGRDLINGYDYFTETLGEYYGKDPSAWLETYITNGKKIPPADFLIPDYIQLKTTAEGIPQFGLSPGVKNATDLFFKD